MRHDTFKMRTYQPSQEPKPIPKPDKEFYLVALQDDLDTAERRLNSALMRLSSLGEEEGAANVRGILSQLREVISRQEGRR